MTADQIDDDILTVEQIHLMLGSVELNANNRCDQCGAQAYVHVAIINQPLTLMFCGHHWGLLQKDGKFTVLRDERIKLEARPTFASLADAL